MAFSKFNKLVLKPIQFDYLVYERDGFCGLSQHKIQTKMRVSYYLHKVSKDQSLIPVLFELFDDNKPRVFWKIKLMWPNKDENLYEFLKEFGLKVLVNAELMCNTGINVSQSMLNNFEEVKVQDLEAEEVSKLALDAYERGIIILEDELLEVPESESNWPQISMFLAANLKPFRFSFRNILLKMEKDSDEEIGAQNANSNSNKRAIATPKRSRKQDLSKVPRIEIPWDLQASASSASSASAISSVDWREVNFNIKYFKFNSIHSNILCLGPKE